MKTFLVFLTGIFLGASLEKIFIAWKRFTAKVTRRMITR